MFPSLNPKKMQAVMKQMGIAQEEIDASRVIIEKSDSSKITIDNPSVIKIKMQGNESFQISGDVSEETGKPFNEDDIKAVMEKTQCSEEQATETLKKTKGDLVEAILELSE